VIYGGTSRICRLRLGTARVKRWAEDAFEPAPLVAPASTDGPADLDGLRQQCDVFRGLVGELLRQAVEMVGLEALRANDAQQYLASLAEIAIELYAAESTVLRVLKLQASRPGTDTTQAEDLARLVSARSAARIDAEATEILGALDEGTGLRDRLAGLARLRPPPDHLLAVRPRVSEELLRRTGRLPSFAAA